MKVLAKLKSEPGIWESTADIPSIGVSDVLIKIRKTEFVELICIF